MTDLEITKLCADAMGFRVGTAEEMGADDDEEGLIVAFECVLAPGCGAKYDPLHDDAQAMALVKRFGLGIYCDEDNGEWGCYKFKEESGPEPDVTNTNLNRAICECVAKMQVNKKGA
jgi:hypothetical protein